ncbi:MAG: alpha/beta hydrolase [Acidobacteriota bacterium]|nr:alpha/beta hydrolase [Acidobacteriota bacterium]MDH3524072.1 alpha/beta hydrolase [Acidobacteriota bacterium]
MSGAEHVVLLHGLFRGPSSMARLARRLREAGFRVHNLRYPSRPRSLEQAEEAVAGQLRDLGLDCVERLHWVTYSLGGIVARSLLTAPGERPRGRLVMLATPNHGSEIVDAIGGSAIFRLVFGELATQLGTSGEGLPQRLAVPDTDIGIIAGCRWINPVGRLLLTSEHDGSVTIASTRLERMADHLVVPRTHTFLMNGPEVAREVAHFLRHGRFAGSPAPLGEGRIRSV